MAAALLCATAPALAACSAGDAALPWRDLYIVAGQSNAAGVASVDDEPGLFGRDTRFANVQIYGIHGAPTAVVDQDGQSSAAQVDWSALAGWHVAAPGFGIKSLAYYREFVRPQAEADALAGLFGPELAFAGQLAAQRPAEQHYLVKLAMPGVTLAAPADATLAHWAPDGALYRELLEMIAAAHASQAATARLRVAGLLWMQGESDALQADSAARYADNLTTFLQRLRGDLAALGCATDADFPVVLGRIQDNPAWSERAQVREAQRAVSTRLPAVTLVDTDDFSAHLLPDGIHFAEAAQHALGERMYRALFPTDETP